MTVRLASEDPIKNYRNRIRCDKFVRAGVQKVSGIKSTTEVVEHSETGNDTPFKSAGQTKYENVQMTRVQLANVPGADDFTKAYELVKSDPASPLKSNYRFNFDLEQYDAGMTLVRVISFRQAWICELIPLSDTDASSSDNSSESITIAHEGYTIKNIAPGSA